MATPIKITPVLQNASSKKFNEQLRNDADKKVSKEEKAQIISLVNKVMANSKKSK